MGVDPSSSDPRGSDYDFLCNVVQTFFLDTRDADRQKFKREAYETWLQSRQRKQIILDAEIEDLRRTKDRICAVLDRQIKRLEMGVE